MDCPEAPWLGFPLDGPDDRLCDTPNGPIPYDPKTKCCEDGEVVDKVEVYVIARDAGGTQFGNHADIVLPLVDTGGHVMAGFFGRGFDVGGGPTGTGFFLDGYVDIFPQDWRDESDPLRVQRLKGPWGKQINQICLIKVCPNQARDILRAIIRWRFFGAPTFHIAGYNCSSGVCTWLHAGGVTDSDDMDYLDTPRNLIRQLVKNNGGKCYWGYTEMDSDSNVTVWFIPQGSR